MKIGIYGGTFDPPHKGHVKAAQTAISELGLDRLLVIPVNIPPHKTLTPGASSPQDRLLMTAMSMEKADRAAVSDIEIKRGGVSYTVDTVSALKKSAPDDEYFLLMGTDMMMCLEKWKDFEKIISMCTLCCFSRDKGERDKIFDRLSFLRGKYGSDCRFVDNDALSVSSSYIREQLCERKGREYLDDDVYGYVIKKRLYGAKPEFTWLREKAYSLLKPTRVQHVKGCEEEAVRLAKRWNADIDDCREAAILHDITKREELTGQLILCEEYGIIPDDMESVSTALLHSVTGAAYARTEFGCNDTVSSAIRWHTTGKSDMTLVEQIIYLADFIEPGRSFPGVDDIRREAYLNLDAAMELAITRSLEHLKEQGICPHPRTEEALAFFRNRVKG